MGKIDLLKGCSQLALTFSAQESSGECSSELEIVFSRFRSVFVWLQRTYWREPSHWKCCCKRSKSWVRPPSAHWRCRHWRDSCRRAGPRWRSRSSHSDSSQSSTVRPTPSLHLNFLLRHGNLFVDVLNDVKLEHLQDVRLQNMVVAAFQLYASVLKDSDTAKDIFKNEFGALPEPSFF